MIGYDDWPLLIMHVLMVRSAEWNWLKGALCTIDRRWGKWREHNCISESHMPFLRLNTLSFGPIIDHTIHHVTDTHVAHHIFSKIPWYNARVMQCFLCRQFYRDDRLECLCLVKSLYYMFLHSSSIVNSWPTPSCNLLVFRKQQCPLLNFLGSIGYMTSHPYLLP